MFNEDWRPSGNPVRLLINPILGQSIDIYNRSDKEYEV